MDWLKRQLREDSGRKFVILNHVYAGARYQTFSLWNDYANQIYFELLRSHRDKIIIELAGHDHFTSMRYHTGSQVFDLPDPERDYDFHNLLIAPSFTPWYKNNPAVSVFEIDDGLTPINLKSTYFNLKPTIGKADRTPYDQLEFRDIDYTQDYKIRELTPSAIDAFRMRLEDSNALQKDYKIRKVGLDPNIPEEVDQAYEIFLEKGLVTKITDNPPTYSHWP